MNINLQLSPSVLNVLQNFPPLDLKELGTSHEIIEIMKSQCLHFTVGRLAYCSVKVLLKVSKKSEADEKT